MIGHAYYFIDKEFHFFSDNISDRAIQHLLVVTPVLFNKFMARPSHHLVQVNTEKVSSDLYHNVARLFSIFPLD